MTADRPMAPYPMVIDGQFVTEPEQFEVLDPATGEVVAYADDCSPEHVEMAMSAAARAFSGGWAQDAVARTSAMLRAAEAIRASADELAPLITREQGKPLEQAYREVRNAVRQFERYSASTELPETTIQDDDVAEVVLTRKPMGVVVAICPWNSPVTVASKVAPVLATGNTVILKPSPYTPLATLRIGGLLKDLFPPGVLNVVSGLDPLGQRLTSHPVPRRVTVTGSIATGRVVMETAAKDFKRVTLELGGNDPAVVLDDADPDVVADGIFAGAFANCGQICVAVKRVYAPREMYDRLVAGLVERARRTVVGNGLDPATEMGPLNNETQLKRVIELVADARAAGAVVVHGGERISGPGYFYEPTIIANARDGMRVVDEEQFGPVLPVIAYDDLEATIAHLNGSEHGLGASVWSRDVERASAVARSLDTGTVWVNAHRVLNAEQPFGGHKSSGVGLQGGELGLEECTELQVVWRGKASSYRVWNGTGSSAAVAPTGKVGDDVTR